MPAPVQLPGIAAVNGRMLLAGGLDAADTSVADVVAGPSGRSPRAQRIGALPQAAHDAGAASLGGDMYVFGGGAASGPIDAITEISPSGATRVAGRLPSAMSDTSAVALGGAAYVIGGYTTTTPLRTVLRWQPGQPARTVATLPRALRYAASTVVGQRIIIVGGTDGVNASDEVLSVTPSTHQVQVIARLPTPLAHAAAVTLGGTVYVIGGRGDALDSQRNTIFSIYAASASQNPHRGTYIPHHGISPAAGVYVQKAGTLPQALSDLAAVTIGGQVLVAGGRDAAGAVHDELWTLRPR